jgi:hypothetical protein
MNPSETTTEADAALQHENSLPPKVIGRPFRPGVSGNPSGRRRGSVSLAATLKSRLTTADAKAIADKLIEQAKAGNRDAIRIILERCDEQPPPPLPVQSADPFDAIDLDHLPQELFDKLKAVMEECLAAVPTVETPATKIPP